MRPYQFAVLFEGKEILTLLDGSSTVLLPEGCRDIVARCVEKMDGRHTVSALRQEFSQLDVEDLIELLREHCLLEGTSECNKNGLLREWSWLMSYRQALVALGLLGLVYARALFKATNGVILLEASLASLLCGILLLPMGSLVHELGHVMIGALLKASSRLVWGLTSAGAPIVCSDVNNLYLLSPATRVAIWLGGAFGNLWLACLGVIGSDSVPRWFYSGVIGSSVFFALFTLLPFLGANDGFYILSTLRKRELIKE